MTHQRAFILQLAAGDIHTVQGGAVIYGVELDASLRATVNFVTYQIAKLRNQKSGI